MLRLDLTRLAREGSVLVEARLPARGAFWEDTGLRFAGLVQVRLKAALAGSGELVVRGSIEAPIESECRRCLEPVSATLNEDVTMVFLASDVSGIEEDGDVRLFDAGSGELDLDGPVREEVILAVDRYVVCSPDCEGLCGRCGANLSTEPCECGEEEPDPRWDALKALTRK